MANGLQTGKTNTWGEQDGEDDTVINLFEKHWIACVKTHSFEIDL